MKYIHTVSFLLFSILFFSCNSDKQDLKSSKTESQTQSSCLQSDVSSQDLEKMIALISEGLLASDKIKIAKQQINTRCITVDQLIEILEVLFMHDDQIIFAKFAYDRVVNKSEFCKVKQGIEFAPAHGKITKFCQQKGVECKPSFSERMENIFN
jgi:transcriptional regulator NrdR family protein